MRPLLVVVFAVLVFGGVGGYLHLSSQVTPPPIDFSEERSTGSYRLELIATFQMVASPFDLEPAAVIVKFRDTEVLREAGPVAAGTRLVVENVEEIVAGPNEFFVKASAADSGEQGEIFGGLSADLNTSFDDLPGGGSALDANGSDASQGNKDVDSKTEEAKAIQVVLLRNDVQVGEAVLFSTGATVEGTLMVEVEPEHLETHQH